LSIALCAALAAACFFAVPAFAGTCGQGTYSYAGLGSRTFVRGVAAAITPTVTSTVRDGHVGGWVGVNGVDKKGNDEWFQIGLSAFPGDATSRIYFEYARPGHQRVYRELSRNVAVGEQHRFAVREVANRHGWWRAWVDGAPVSAPIYLPGSHGKWTAQMVGESWAGKTAGACNLYSYSFGQVALSSATNGAWGPVGSFDRFQDAGYRLVRNSLSSFLAASVAPVTRAPAGP
jgi:hypothetical protein